MTFHSDTLTSPICPCKGCDRRTMTCHGVCVQYKDWKAYKARINAKKQLKQSSHTDREQMPFWRERNRQERNRRNGGHKED